MPRATALLLAAAVALCAVPAGGASTSAMRPSAKAGKKEAEPPREPAAEGKQVRCLAIKAKGGALEPTRYALAAALEPKEVEIVIHACGLSRGDVALASEEDAVFPLIPGREIIGHVVAAGSAVTSVRPGMRVGVGLQMGDVDGDVLMSEAPVTVGGLADRIRVRSRWAFPVPDALPTEQAAPLFGAGAAAWSHLSRAKLKRGSKVAVVGLGGIGHLAVQFASRMGHAVTIVGDARDGERAEEDGAQLGSSAFVPLTEADGRKKAARKFDLVLCTLDSADLAALGLKWSDCLKLLKNDGKFCVACDSAAEVSFPMKALTERRLTLQTSAALSRNSVRDMLRFCEKHRVCGLTETSEMDLPASNAALARVGSNGAKYRHVLVRSAAMQAYTLKRRDTGGFSVPGLGSLPSMPLPAGLRRATDSMLAQSGVLAKQLAERSRDALANATASLNSSSLQAGLQAAAASVQRGMASAANQSELAVRGMLAKSKSALQPKGGKAAGGKGGRSAGGRQSGGSIGTLPSTVRPPDARMASALKQKRAALAAARMSLSADDEDEDETDADDDDDADDESADDADEEEEEEEGDDDADAAEAAADDADDADDDAESDDGDDEEEAAAPERMAVTESARAAAGAPAAAAAEPSAPPPSDGDFAAAAGGGEDAWGDDGAADDWASEVDSEDTEETPP